MLVLLKHINNTDVAIEILKKFYVPEKQLYKLKVRWWNIVRARRNKSSAALGPHPHWNMGIVEKIEINRADITNWKIYT